MAYQNQVEQCIPETATASEALIEQKLREAIRRKEEEKRNVLSERQQHERRVWEMLNSVVRACYSVDRITAVEVNHWAEEVVAEYERRMKEREEGEK